MASVLEGVPIGQSVLQSTNVGRSVLDGAPLLLTKPRARATPMSAIQNGLNNVGRAVGGAESWFLHGTASNASALSKALDYQRARSQEAIFHKGSSDANRKALRQRLGMERGYEDPTLFGSGDRNGIAIPGWLQHLVRGGEDTVLDFGSDPLNYETGFLGAGRQLLVKGAGAVADIAERLAPETTESVRAGARVAQERFGLGGAGAVRVGRTRGKAAKDTVLGASAHSDTEAAHIKSLLQKRVNDALKPLNHENRVSVLRALNGEIPIPASGPLRDVILSVRKATDDAFYLQGTAGARRVLPYIRSRVNANVRQRITEPPPPAKPDLFRYQTTAGEPEISPRRGGTFFSMGKPTEKYSKSKKLGGQNLIERINQAKRPLDIRYNGARQTTNIDKLSPEELAYARKHRFGEYEHLPAAGVAAHIFPQEVRIGSDGKEFLGPVPEATELWDAFHEKDMPTLHKWLKRLGVPQEEIDTHYGHGNFYAAEDRIGVELARQAGHDALIMRPNPEAYPISRPESDEFIALHPSAHGPVPSPKTDFESMVPAQSALPSKIVRVRKAALPAKPYELPPNLREFAQDTGNATLDKFRKKYVTGLNTSTKDAADSLGFTVKPEDYFNPNLLTRGEFAINPGQIGEHVDALLRSLGNAGRAVGSARLNRRLRDAFGGEIPHDVSEALEKQFGATGENRDDLTKLLDLGRKVTGYGKSAQTQFTPFHAANVFMLHLLNNAERTPQVLSRFAKMLANRNNPEKLYELMRPGVERGAIGPAKDQASMFSKVPVLGPWTKAMGDITWGLDNAVKTEYSKRLGDGYSAGRRASEDLIDYRNPSDFSRNVLSLLSKFPTYRSQLFPAVIKSVLRDPRRAAALMRATGGVATGDEIPLGNGHRLKSYTAVADAGRALGDHMGYVRSTLGDPQKALLTLLGIGHGHNSKYFTYGHDVDLRALLDYAAGGIPEGRDVLNEAGQGIFPGRGIGNDLLFGVSGTAVK